MRAALFFAARGVPVLPLHTPGRQGCSCSRRDCDRVGKHPRLPHGLTQASTDPLVVAGWWRRWPTANLGLCTGRVMDVADVDSDAGRRAVLRLLGGRLPDGPAVRTGAGGWHLWFAPTGHGNRVRVLPGVDWRGAGGYVVTPPSRHASGAAYTWLRRPFAEPLPVCPPALADLLGRAAGRDRPLGGAAGRDRPVGGVAGRDRPVGGVAGRDRPVGGRRPDRYAGAALAAEESRVACAPVGSRNDTLNRAAWALGRLVAAGLLDPGEVVSRLSAAARTAGLGRAETARTIRSGLGAGVRLGATLDRPRSRRGSPG